MSALKRFAQGVSTPVKNPLALEYGAAYQLLVEADALSCQDKTAQALDKYRQAIDLRKDFTLAYMGAGRCLRRKGDLKGAIDYFQSAHEKNAFNEELHVELAKCYNDAGMLKKAKKHYRMAIKLDRSLVEAKFGLALLHELDEEPDQAIKLYKELIQQDQDFLPAYNNLGSIYMRQGEFIRAKALFLILTERAPDFARGFLGMALTLDKSGELKASLPYYEKALALKPNSRNGEYIRKRIIEINYDLGRFVQRDKITLVRVK
jgi:tetratricopeptide (TPR) repeat protein